MHRQIAVIGVSAGGLEAVGRILEGLPPDLGLAVLVVQHRSKESNALCELLQACTTLPVHEPSDKEAVEPGHIYLAPADYHLLVEPGYLTLSCDEPEFFSRPSIDLAFETAADSYGARSAGVVLTGANADGSRGLSRIAARGGAAIVQDPTSAEVPTMPAAALEAVPAAEVLTLEGIAERLSALGRPAPERTRVHP